jgi:hypothetical protein
MSPQRPVQPVKLRNMLEVHNRLQRAANGALRASMAFAAGSPARRKFVAEAVELQKSANVEKDKINTWSYHTDEGKAYLARVTEWNSYVAASKAESTRIRRTRKNVSEADAVRSKACGRCFATHAGEC